MSFLNTYYVILVISMLCIINQLDVFFWKCVSSLDVDRQDPKVGSLARISLCGIKCLVFEGVCGAYGDCYDALRHFISFRLAYGAKVFLFLSDLGGTELTQRYQEPRGPRLRCVRGAAGVGRKARRSQHPGGAGCAGLRNSDKKVALWSPIKVTW